MARTTLADAKASRIAEALNIASTDARFTQFINDSIRELLHLGKWWGTFGRYAISVDSQLMTLPTHIDTVEAIMISKTPVPLRSQFFEFIGFGHGERDDTLTSNGINECLYRGTVCTAKAMSANSTVTVKCDVVDDVTKEVRILGYDENGNWVRTEPGGVGTGWEDGEVLALAQGAGTTSSTTFSRISDIQAPSTLDGKWYLYQGSVATGTLIGSYEYWETRPEYKSYLLPFASTDVTTVTVMGKLAFRPAVNDTDVLLIGNLGALKSACMALKFEEEGNPAMASLYMFGGNTAKGQKIVGAVQKLEAELTHENGEGTELGINLTGPGVGYGDAFTEEMV